VATGSQEYFILPHPNSLLHYGTYCGPGPDRSVNSKPMDAIDAVCLDHDIDYNMCLPEDEIPKYMNQLISIRGKIPSFLSKDLSTKYETYNHCIHRADLKLVKKLEILESNIQSLGLARDVEGRITINNMCAVGLNLGGSTNPLCFLSTHKMFTSLAVNLFSSDLEVDEINFNSQK
jgi:hypothetical protein